jgi:hypothetical protein
MELNLNAAMKKKIKNRQNENFSTVFYDSNFGTAERGT